MVNNGSDRLSAKLGAVVIWSNVYGNECFM